MEGQQRTLVVLRLSAMGDVALVTPVIQSLLAAHPDCRVIMVTRPKFSIFFNQLERVTCFAADVDGQYKGVLGLVKLFNELKKTQPFRVIDLHDHIRTRFLCFLFRTAGVPVVRFDKGRPEKKKFTRKENKEREPLKHTVLRYAEAFQRAGFNFDFKRAPFFQLNPESERRLNDWLESLSLKKTTAWIGVAPFAAHKSKIWPVERWAVVIRELQEKMPAKFFLFGGGPHEVAFFQTLVNQFPESCVLVAGQLKLPEELVLIKMLDKMICVDSSNMHLAALSGVTTVSIWGGTHPDVGFGPFGNAVHSEIQVDPMQLPCRPCSVYGLNTCLRHDFACLHQISTERVVNEVLHGLV